MKQESYTTTVLRAEEGHVLTEAADALRAEQIAAFDRLAAERRARIEAAANNPDMQP